MEYARIQKLKFMSVNRALRSVIVIKFSIKIWIKSIILCLLKLNYNVIILIHLKFSKLAVFCILRNTKLQNSLPFAGHQWVKTYISRQKCTFLRAGDKTASLSRTYLSRPWQLTKKRSGSKAQYLSHSNFSFFCAFSREYMATVTVIEINNNCHASKILWF